jgi:hypothetical protein
MLFRPRSAQFRPGERLDLGGLSVRLKVEPRARSIRLRIDRARREAVAIAPSARGLAEAARFADSHRDWIAARLAALTPPRSLAQDSIVTVFGRDWRLVPDGRRPRLIVPPDTAPTRLHGCGDGAVDGQLVTRAVKREALAVFADRVQFHCAALGVAAPTPGLADARTRWGSCSPARRGRPASIRLSWRLAFAPFAVADYVAAHECAHLIEANHGPRFWALVETLVGDPRPHRAWLRAHGEGLHALAA